MTPDRFESSSIRRRLPGRTERRGSRTGLSTPGTFAFGGVFVVVGSVIVLAGTKIIHVDPKNVHGPYWMLTVVGLVFALAGVVICGMAWRQFASEKRLQQKRSCRPDDLAVADYGWDPRGFVPSRWGPPAKALGVAAFLSLFLSIFNWLAFVNNGPVASKAVVGLFDLANIWVWCVAGFKIARALKFGDSRLEFLKFPYPLDEPLVIRWWPATGIARVDQGTFTLRCVEEWQESRGQGDNQTSILIHEEIWSGVWSLDQATTFPRLESMELRCDLPADAVTTQLSADKPIFWELEVKLDLPGLDFVETYLVPLYALR